MNIYKLSNEEIMKAHNEFNRTAFGWRVKMFSMIPWVLAWIGFIGVFALLLIDQVFKTFNKELFLEFNTMLSLLVVLSVINISLWCIAQLHYGRLLKEYVETNKKK